MPPGTMVNDSWLMWLNRFLDNDKVTRMACTKHFCLFYFLCRSSTITLLYHLRISVAASSHSTYHQNPMSGAYTTVIDMRSYPTNAWQCNHSAYSYLLDDNLQAYVYRLLSKCTVSTWYANEKAAISLSHCNVWIQQHDDAFFTFP